MELLEGGSGVSLEKPADWHVWVDVRTAPGAVPFAELMTDEGIQDAIPSGEVTLEEIAIGSRLQFDALQLTRDGILGTVQTMITKVCEVVAPKGHRAVALGVAQIGQPETDKTQYMDLEEVATLLDMSPKEVLELVMRGELPRPAFKTKIITSPKPRLTRPH